MLINYDGTSNEGNFPLIGHFLPFTKVHWNRKKCKIVNKEDEMMLIKKHKPKKEFNF